MLFKDTKRLRLSNYDYASTGYYFVTICTLHRVQHFGSITDGVMQLSSIGELVAQEWLQTFQLRKYIFLDEWVVMPDHFHCIIVIKNPDTQQQFSQRNVDISWKGTGNIPWKDSGDTPRRVPTVPALIDADDMTYYDHLTPLIPNSLSSIINHFKGAVTKQAHQLGYKNFRWQPRFYDRIIRNERELYNVRRYIINNPKKWSS